MTPKVTSGPGLVRNGSSVNPLFNHAAEPSSQYDRFRPAPLKNGAAEQNTSLTGRGATHSPSGAGSGTSQRQSVFGQLASPSLGHLQHAGGGRVGGADVVRAASKMPEVSTTRSLPSAAFHPLTASYRLHALCEGLRPQSHLRATAVEAAWQVGLRTKGFTRMASRRDGMRGSQEHLLTFALHPHYAFVSVASAFRFAGP
jgi:hypothetical protein